MLFRWFLIGWLLAGGLPQSGMVRADQRRREPNTNDPSTVEDFRAGDKSRETQRPRSILKAVHLSKGDWVADVGSGDGFYSMGLSRIVGPSGKVFAEEIWDMAVGWSTKRVSAFRLTNVSVVKGQRDNPQLPEKRLSGVLVVDAYHHFTQFREMNKRMFDALLPGGRIVIADYSLPANRASSRSAQVKMHEISPQLVQTELREAGFVVLTCQDPFVRRMPQIKNGDRRINVADMWLIAAVRPR